MRLHKHSKISFLIVTILMLPSFLSAQTTENFEVSGWIPYWRAEAGVESALRNLNAFTEINPFMYTVKQNGDLFEAADLSDSEWKNLRKEAEKKGVRFIPTVMWANPDAMDEVFKDPIKRQNHIREIAWEVNSKNLDGIDIDYEAKYARTRPYFSLFLKELDQAIGYDKWIMCTIEARTPLDSIYSSPASIPDDIEYANDFKEINKYCDRVRIMTYDQGRYDLKLNQANDHPYAPVADPAWVEKVVRLTMKDINKDKILIGVPTYGYEYDMFLSTGAGTASAIGSIKGASTQYSRLWSFNPRYATEHAEKIDIEPKRQETGEMILIYPAKKSSDPDAIPLRDATRIMVWNDAESIRQKAELAKKLGVRGISVFKIDGGEDPKLIAVLDEFETAAVSKKKPPTTLTEVSEPLSQNPVPNQIGLLIPTKDLEKGDRNENVRTLQKILNSRGFTVATSGPGSPGNETSIFGDATEAALIRFQKVNGITPTAGYYGPKTRGYLQATT